MKILTTSTSIIMALGTAVLLVAVVPAMLGSSNNNQAYAQQLGTGGVKIEDIPNLLAEGGVKVDMPH
jgi:hypothetical protein